jgi:hypothetical protein
MDKNQLLLKQVVSAIPKNIKPWAYLANKLGLSKVSAYRRIRGETPFSFDEAVRLSMEMGLSLDAIAEQGQEQEETSFSKEKRSGSSQAQTDFLDMLEEYYCCMELVGSSKEQEIRMSAKQLNLFFLLDYDVLFKLYYYYWIHRIGDLPVSLTFSKISLSEKMEAVRQKIRTKKEKLKPVNLILDKDLFSGFVRETVYYYRRKLISEKELRLIRRELTILLYRLERLITQPPHNGRYRFYLSLLDVESDSIYAACDCLMLCLHWSYSIKIKRLTINTANDEWQKRRWDSMERHSALISGSNELLQTEFIERQWAEIASLC